MRIFLRRARTLRALAALCLWAMPAMTQAGVDEGIAWLRTQPSADRSFGGTPTSLATVSQSTAEVLAAYQALGREAEAPYAGALTFLGAAAEPNTESLARRIFVSARAGLDVTTLAADLLRRQNPDGGFGEQEGSASSVFDTAFALQALAPLPLGPASAAATGYLLQAQRPDGGWSDGANETSVELTALALRALSPYRFAYAGVSAVAGSAQSLLLARRTGDGWSEGHVSALALTALVPNLPDLAPVSGALAALSSAQLADGSWDEDAFTTALALEALDLASRPRPDPTLGAVAGRIFDGAPGQALAGVTVSVAGTGSYSGQTGADGRFLIAGVKQGAVTLTAAKTGYLTVAGAGTVAAGATLDFTTALARDPQPVPIVLRGLVVESSSGAPLAGALAQVLNSTQSARTGGDGRFELGDVLPGSIQLQVTLAGYSPASFAVSAPSGGAIDLGLIALAAAGGGTAGRLDGSVADALTGRPLIGALVSLSGSESRTAFTDATGAFAIDGIAPGPVNVTASLAGYDSATGAGTVLAGGTLRFDARLVRTGDPARATVTGSVIDADTHAALAGVLVSVDGGLRSAFSGANGSFEIGDVPGGQLAIDLTLSGYNAVSYAVSAPRGGLVALGVVSLSRTPAPGGTNRNPVITSHAPPSGPAGNTYAYNVVATDPDGDAIVYALGAHPSGMTIDAGTGQIRWIPTLDQVGTRNFTVVVVDARAGRSEELATVNVTAGGSRSYVITDVQTLSGLYVNDTVPQNYVVGTYVSGGVAGFVVGGPPCPLSWFTGSGTLAQALSSLERLTAPNSLGGQPATGSDILFDLHQPYATVTVFPQIDHEPFPQEGIEYTVWGSNDRSASFPDEWRLGTLMAIYRKGYVVTPSCAGQDETDDYAGLYTFGADSFRYLRVRTDYSITIFDTPAHTTFNGAGDESGLPGWQSSEGEIDGVGGMVCDVAPQADAGPDIVGRTGQVVHFDATGSEAGLVTYGWDLDGDGTIDLTGATPSYVFNAAFEGDVRLLVISAGGCVGTDTIHVKIEVNVPRPDLTVTAMVTDGVVTDLQTLGVSGTAQVAVRNVGAIATDRSALVTVFEDANGNGSLETATDNVLGTLTMPSALASGAAQTVDVPLSGTVRFRDASLFAMVDSDGQIDESREDNNVASSAAACRIPPETRTFSPALKWAWQTTTALPLYNQVMSAPVVAPLEDTNGDGKIDHQDIPSVIFHSYRHPFYQSDGVLRALSGTDGHELWSVTDPAYRTDPAGQIAVADLDGDGVVEIIAPRSGAGLLVFDHSGAFKWQNTTLSVGWGGAAIADLDGDGKPEIVVGRTALRRDGTLLWQGTSYTGGASNGPLSVVADINLDGRPEVVAGGVAYSSTGQLLWQNSTVGDGFAAVANFNSDPYPEIVVGAFAARVFLLDHNGAIIWGPVPLPGGGLSGPPTIADFDGDGRPDIGVAAATSYTVIKANGQILWSKPVQDGSSSVTGSSVFDFDGDGRAEVVYADENFLRVFRGTDGTVLFQVPNTSGTAYELPVIADVDADGHADIVVCTNQLLTGLSAGSTGLRVYTDANNSWVPTRRIWNQHTYHITNITDDGAVPAHERNSWEEHNTYRLNALVGVDANLLSDLTLSSLRVTAGAGGRPVGVTVRVGNAGGGPSPATTVTFYEGDPAAGGVRIGTVAVAALAPGAFQDVTLTDLPDVSGTADLFAVVDETGTVRECRETNNAVRRVVGTQSLFADLVVGTNAPVYPANSPALLQASVTNLSALPGAFRVQLQVEDVAGVVVAQFAPRDTGTLSGGTAIQQTETWNTGGSLAGVYRLRGRLVSLAGDLLREATSTFAIRHDAGGASAVTLRTSTDHPAYHTTDQVGIEDLVANVSANTLVSGATVRVTVRDSLDRMLAVPDAALAVLGPGAKRSVLASLALRGAPLGTYHVEAAILEAGTQAVLVSASASFEVINDPRKALTATVEVLAASVEAGQPESCTDRVTNVGTGLLAGLELRHVLAAVDAEAEVSATTLVRDLAAASTDVDTRAVPTGPLSPGRYACLVQARIAGTLETLAFTPFVVVEAPIKLAAALELKGNGRLLVLLDGPHPCDDDDDHQVHDGLDYYGDDGHGDRSRDTEHNHGHTCDSDPHGPRNAPALAGQKEFLGGLLRQSGWSFTLTDTPQAFTRELRTGGYSVYALLSEDVHLDETVQKELREAVFRGEGLLVAGAHDSRNQGVEDALGVTLIGSVATAATVDLTPGLPGATGGLPLLPDDRGLRIRRGHASSAGTYVPSFSSSRDHDDCHPGRDDDHDDDCGERFPDAVTRNAYGRGRAVFAGFDLLAAATYQGASGPAAGLLRAALAAINPASPRAGSRAVVPVTVMVENLAKATPARVEVLVPDGARIVDAPGGTILDRTATWDFPLAASESATRVLWIQLPSTSGPVNVEAVASAPDGAGVHRPRAETSLTIAVVAARDAASVRGALEVAVGSGGSADAVRRAIREVVQAGSWLPGRPDRALDDALEAADDLLNAHGSGVDAARVALDEWIRALAQAVPPPRKDEDGR